MRRKIYSNIEDSYVVLSIAFFILLLSNIFVSSDIVIAQEEKQMVIEIRDVDGDLLEDEVYEDEFFIVSVYDPDAENETPYLTDVLIEFNGESQITSEDENGEITFKAPQVSQDILYTIIASKDGYISVEENITIINKQLKLVVIPEKDTVEANKLFSVKVTDENGNSVADALVAIQSFGDKKTTDGTGRVWLTAPGGRTEIIIIAQKEGYQDGTTNVMVDIFSPPWESPYTPIVAAVILLILAIVFVNVRQNRQKRYIDMRSREISKEQVLKRYGSHGAVVSSQSRVKTGETVDRYGLKEEEVQMEPKRGPRVEEIRISKPRKDKKIVPVKTEEGEVRKVIPRKTIRKHDYDWFEGTDDIRYEIDKITGEIDEEGMDKWFEGIDDIRAKIDEKVKKKDKKKDK